MKIILTGATGVLGSHVMYEILEQFIKQNNNDQLFLIVRSKGNFSAFDRINKLLTSNYTPDFLKNIPLSKVLQYISIIDTDLSDIDDSNLEKIKGAYFIHSAGYVNLSTDDNQKDKIFEENTAVTKLIFNTFKNHISKFVYISTAFSSGIRNGIIDNNFHTLNFKPKHRNAYENAKFDSESFVIEQCKTINLPFQILRPSVIGGKMLDEDNKFFISKFMVFYLLAKFFHFAANKSKQQENVRFIINETTGLNIIPVDYVAKVIVKVFNDANIKQLNIVNHTSFNVAEGLNLIMKEVGYSNFNMIKNPISFEYKNTIEKLYYESIGKHLKPYFITDANEYDTTLLNSILKIPNIDNETLTNMINYARINDFKDVNV